MLLFNKVCRCVKRNRTLMYFLACVLVFAGLWLFSQLSDVQNFSNETKDVEWPTIQVYDLPETAVLVMAANREAALRNHMNQLLKFRPSDPLVPIIISQDGNKESVTRLATSYASSSLNISFIHHKYRSSSGRRVDRILRNYFYIAEHFKWALDRVFFEMGYSTVIVTEDDLDISSDFFSYFAATRHLLFEDNSILCVSAWNDNGAASLTDRSKSDLLHRTDFFPGLGWMLTASVWKELSASWPEAYWDDWLRMPEVRKGRACIRPEVSRTAHNMKLAGKGSSEGLFKSFLSSIRLPDTPVDFSNVDVSSLKKKEYDISLAAVLRDSMPLTFEQLNNTLDATKTYKTIYKTPREFKILAKKYKLMGDIRSGMPRTSYYGIVPFICNGARVYAVHGNFNETLLLDGSSSSSLYTEIWTRMCRYLDFEEQFCRSDKWTGSCHPEDPGMIEWFERKGYGEILFSRAVIKQDYNSAARCDTSSCSAPSVPFLFDSLPVGCTQTVVSYFMGKPNACKRAGKNGGKHEPSNRKTGSGVNKVPSKKSPKEEESSKTAPVSPIVTPLTIRDGFVIKCKNADPNNRYQLVVKRQITDRIYVVHNTKLNKMFCLKVEPFNAVNELKQLRRDLYVMCDARRYPKTLGSHFFPVTNKGVVDNLFNYITMPLGEASIADIRKTTVKSDFCLKTAVRLSLETFQAINDLHSLNYIHRAIGPTKFVVGPEGCRLYMVGLSLAKCVNTTSKSTPKHIHKYGDNRFQSRSWHKRREQYFKDDVESWLYMALDFCAPKNLPWTTGMLDLQILEMKENFLGNSDDYASGSLPKIMKTVKQKVGELKGADKLDYRCFKELLLDLKREVGCEMKGPYNWKQQKNIVPMDDKEKIVDSKKAFGRPDGEQSRSATEKSPTQKSNIGESPFVNDNSPKVNEKHKIKRKVSKKKTLNDKPKEFNNVQMIFDQIPLVTVDEPSEEQTDVSKSGTSQNEYTAKNTSKKEGDSEADEVSCSKAGRGNQFEDDEDDKEDDKKDEAPFDSKK
ncbi:hypothetical protein QR680_014212 [Steinernema hermaphroditum]|uniref:alpha-1,3-mannosyl-glycoprotein 2-beta-N-acetylglucosaminyltransferase n=1 Tax=Steinernema hermaphroditum TaxID=289476 RepID=A0AA39M3U4_9BILA|nr:hypothetical protein QR680_014212 [Steinernema hermaphroditum]